MINSILFPSILIILSLLSIPFLNFYGIPFAAIGVIWLIISLVVWNNKKEIKNLIYSIQVLMKPVQNSGCTGLILNR